MKLNSNQETLWETTRGRGQIYINGITTNLLKCVHTFRENYMMTRIIYLNVSKCNILIYLMILFHCTLLKSNETVSANTTWKRHNSLNLIINGRILQPETCNNILMLWFICTKIQLIMLEEFMIWFFSASLVLLFFPPPPFKNLWVN